ncbi:MAG TPA: hypothetical protein VH539_14830 [Gemmatimonadaceae bacterium]
MTSRLRTPRILTLLATACAVLSVGMTACGSLTRPKAQAGNATDTITVYALNGTPVDAPSGLWLFGQQAVVINSSFSFDLALDLDSQGQMTLYTVRFVAGALSAAHSVGMQRMGTDFDALLKAPSSGYVTDSLFTANVGDVFAIQTSDATACGFSVFSNVIYAKVQVLAVDPVARTMRTRFTVDPNCGFFSLIPSGTPKD